MATNDQNSESMEQEQPKSGTTPENTTSANAVETQQEQETVYVEIPEADYLKLKHLLNKGVMQHELLSFFLGCAGDIPEDIKVGSLSDHVSDMGGHIAQAYDIIAKYC